MAPTKTIYVPENKQWVFEEAQKLLGEESISSAIITSLEASIQRKKEEAKGIIEYELVQMNRKVKVIGRIVTEALDHREHFEERDSEDDLQEWSENWNFTAYKTKSGKLVVNAILSGSEPASIVYSWDSVEDFFRASKRSNGYVFENHENRTFLYPKEFIEQIQNSEDYYDYEIID